ncbi:Uncharacterised protein [Escherichia coli]|uniref:Uncharacterized protein n=1 Tax=Escherichia coli TaxID=562 RepID=A0A376KJM3_ECOLX|nr:Uncharacterised protein [Escherichia coli]
MISGYCDVLNDAQVKLHAADSQPQNHVLCLVRLTTPDRPK